MKQWKAVPTRLLVGEGATEEAFLRHVKRLYVPRDAGLRVTIKNAHGKGAKHVIDWTSRQIGDYDAVAVLLDTDQDWTQTVAKKARGSKIIVLKSEPLFEALLLRLIRQSDIGNSKALKARLAPFVCNNSLLPENYIGYFGRDCLEAGRNFEPTIDQLLNLLIP